MNDFAPQPEQLEFARALAALVERRDESGAADASFSMLPLPEVRRSYQKMAASVRPGQNPYASIFGLIPGEESDEVFAAAVAELGCCQTPRPIFSIPASCCIGFAAARWRRSLMASFNCVPRASGR